jgi:hypothetical protein
VSLLTMPALPTRLRLIFPPCTRAVSCVANSVHLTQVPVGVGTVAAETAFVATSAISLIVLQLFPQDPHNVSLQAERSPASPQPSHPLRPPQV